MEIPYQHMNIPYSKDGLENVLPAIFRSLPTCSTEKDSIIVTDYTELFRWIGYKRTPEQVKVHADYFFKHFEGKFFFNQFIAVFSNVHRTSGVVRAMIETIIDRDKNGYISADEFTDMIEMLRNYDRRLIGTPY